MEHTVRYLSITSVRNRKTHFIQQNHLLLRITTWYDLHRSDCLLRLMENVFRLCYRRRHHWDPQRWESNYNSFRGDQLCRHTKLLCLPDYKVIRCLQIHLNHVREGQFKATYTSEVKYGCYNWYWNIRYNTTCRTYKRADRRANQYREYSYLRASCKSWGHIEGCCRCLAKWNKIFWKNGRYLWVI